ncbi:MAG: cell wall hydrolase, partial [Phocaeicola sp.]
ATLLVESLLALTLNIFYEARGEGEVGMHAVADVTIIRAKTPSNVVNAVLAPYQFSWVKDKLKPKERNLFGLMALQRHILHSGKFKTQEIEAYRRAERIASKVLQDRYKPRYRFTHFHVVGLKPNWGGSGGKRIGNHVFYRL